MTAASQTKTAEVRRRQLFNAAAAAGATALATVFVCLASLLVGASGVQNVILYAFGHLTVSIAVIGVWCVLIAFVVGWARAAAESRWLTALFLTFAPGVVAYVLTAFWLVNALYVLILAVLIGLVAAPVYLLVAWKLVPAPEG